MDTKHFHEILGLDDQIKAIEGQLKELKAKRISIKEKLIEELAEGQMIGVVIGTKQITMTQKEVMNISNKEGLKQLLKETHPEFTKIEIDEKSFESYVLDITTSERGFEEQNEEDEEKIHERIIPDEFKGLISFFTVNDIKITKAKKQ